MLSAFARTLLFAFEFLTTGSNQGVAYPPGNGYVVTCDVVHFLAIRRNYTMKILAVIFLTGLLSGSSSLPPQYSASPSRCLMQSVTVVEPVKRITFQHAMLGALDPDDHSLVVQRRPTWSTHVLIRSVDDGNVLWVHPNRLGDQVRLEPGVHKLSVICSTDYSWGTMSRGPDVDLIVRLGCAYSLATSQLKSMSNIRHVDVTEKPIH